MKPVLYSTIVIIGQCMDKMEYVTFGHFLAFPSYEKIIFYFVKMIIILFLTFY